MKLFKPYTNIENFLQRFTLLKLGKLHIRLHNIVGKDQTSFYHNHPFHYLSFVLKGGYLEKIYNNETEKVTSKSRGLFSIIYGSKKKYHRIEETYGETLTLFIAYGNYNWNAINTEKSLNKDGLYQRNIKGNDLWSKRKDDIWYIGNKNKNIALDETRHSIHQVL